MSARRMPFDHHTSALEQLPSKVAEYPLSAWAHALEARPAKSHSEQELATLLLAVNYELLGYPPAHAWLLAKRGETGPSGRLDG